MNRVWIYLVVMALLSYNFILWSRDNVLRIYCLNIGQGDSILIKSPDNKYILVDGGPDNTVLSELEKILPFWVRNIDLTILTHPDLDHLGGIIDVVERYSIQKIAFNKVEHNSYAFSLFQNIVKEKGIEFLLLRDNNDFKFGCCLEIDMLWPEEDTDLDLLDVNDTSFAFLLKYNQFEMYLGGDLGVKYEEKIVKNTKYDIDIVKLGHHGSKTSTSDFFLSSLKPEIAIISCGKNNKFNHPHPEVIDILEKRDLKLFRTDTYGRIEIVSNGEFYWIK